MIKTILKRFRKFTLSLLQPFQWPTKLFYKGVDRARQLGISEGDSRFSFRFTRYWFAASAIHAEAKKKKTSLTVVDLGCERGILKTFSGSLKNVSWIGLDLNPRTEILNNANYDKIIHSNFDSKLPLEDDSADVVVCLHVFEHLPRPEFTIGEISRILKPGGLFIGASPIKPFRFIAHWRTRKLRKQLARDESRIGKHINAFCRDDWFMLLKKNGMQPGRDYGGHLLRWKKNPLENCSAWVRFNQLWGVLFPSLGGELFIQGRKPHTRDYLPSPPRFLISPAALRTAAFCFMIIVIISGKMFLTEHGSNINRLIVDHQDGNDCFYVCKTLKGTNHYISNRQTVLEDHLHIQDILAKDRARGVDSHFWVNFEDLEKLSQLPAAKDLRIVKVVNEGEHTSVLLGSEHYGEPLLNRSYQNDEPNKIVNG